MNSSLPPEEDEKSFRAQSGLAGAGEPLSLRHHTRTGSQQSRKFQPTSDAGVELLEFGFFVPADVGLIDSAVQHVLSESRQLDRLRGDMSALRIALKEALLNAITHGCGHDPKKSVEIVVDFDDPAGVSLMVRDPGSGFDSDQVLRSQAHSNGASKQKGIQRILHNMDEVHFKAHGTEIHMFKRLGRTDQRLESG